MKTNKLFRFFIVVVTILMVFSGVKTSEVKAQSGTTLSILPSNPTVCLNDEVTLQVWVNNVVDMYGMDLYLSFETGDIEVLEISQGPFLDPGWVFFNEYNNATGTIHYTMTQLNPSTPKDNSGVLLNIRVRVLNLSADPVQMNIVTTGPIPTHISAVGGVTIPYTVATNASIITDACVADVGVSPVTAAASMCFETIVKVHITDVNDLYGFSLDLTFDPSVIEILGVTNGGFLTYGAPFLNNFNNTTGTINYAAFQIAPTLPKSGSGDLISIRLRGKKESSSTALTLLSSSLLSDRNSYEIPAVLTGGTITTDACNPTAVELRSFSAERAKWAINLKWVTVSESDNLGFNIFRAASPRGPKHKVNKELIPTLTYPGSLVGSAYSFVDRSVVPDKVYYYWLQDVDIYGHKTMHGPIKVLKNFPLKR